MREFRTKINENGRIVIPALCRRQLHLKPGENLIIRIDNDEMRIYSAKHSLEKAQKLIQKHAKDKNLVKELKLMRRKDFQHE